MVPKKSIKFDFNSGYHLRILTDERRVEEINLNTTDPEKSNIRQILSWDLFETAGVPGSISFMMRLEQNRSFWGVSTFVEQPDEDLLKREPLLDDDGALYKMFNETTNATSCVEKKTQRIIPTTHFPATGVLRSLRMASPEQALQSPPSPEALMRIWISTGSAPLLNTPSELPTTS